MRYNINNLSLFESGLFHDYSVSKINCDYENHVVEIPIVGQNDSCWLFFSDVKGLSVSIEEPWGEGIYVSEIIYKIATDMPENAFDFIVQVNSGDKITVSCTEFEVKHST